jgi:hypothetical protein
MMGRIMSYIDSEGIPVEVFENSISGRCPAPFFAREGAGRRGGIHILSGTQATRGGRMRDEKSSASKPILEAPIFRVRRPAPKT